MKRWADLTQAVVATVAIVIGGWWTYRIFVQEREGQAHAIVTEKLSQSSLTSQVNLLQVVVRIENTGHVLIPVKYVEISVQQLTPIEGCEGATHCVIDELNDALSSIDRTADRFNWPDIAQRVSTYSDPRPVEPGESEYMDFELAVPASIQTVRVYAFVRNDESSQGYGWHDAQLYAIRAIPGVKDEVAAIR